MISPVPTNDPKGSSMTDTDTFDWLAIDKLIPAHVRELIRLTRQPHTRRMKSAHARHSQSSATQCRYLVDRVDKS